MGRAEFSSALADFNAPRNKAFRPQFDRTAAGAPHDRIAGPLFPELEQLQPEEDSTIEELCNTFDVILDTTAKDYGHAVRAVHAKAHGVLEGLLRTTTTCRQNLSKVFRSTSPPLWAGSA